MMLTNSYPFLGELSSKRNMSRQKMYILNIRAIQLLELRYLFAISNQLPYCEPAIKKFIKH